ncbi:kinase [Streptomyces sp. NPDC087658]|uniref:GHMP family kinase ATP-binding protein n=1 Tax=Streptomyces sp. NPDC087658 TaxID=3365800 RepID=UPI00381514BF
MPRCEWRPGEGRAPAHHGEILQGVFRDGTRQRRGLVTLPCSLYTAQASFVPRQGEPVSVRPAWKEKARLAAELTLAAIEGPDAQVGGVLEIENNAPIRRGFGSSTSDVLATVRAVGDALDSPLLPATVARLAVRAEAASDSLMFEDTAVLFAQREGEMIEDFGVPLPPLLVLGFGTGPGNCGVDTLAMPPARYTRREAERFAELRGILREALALGDGALLGSVATASTRINQRHLPIPGLDQLLAVSQECGAVGLHAAHSGDIAGLLFAESPDTEPRMDYAETLLQQLNIHEQWRFRTSEADVAFSAL